jgi:hypothetical protein
VAAGSGYRAFVLVRYPITAAASQMSMSSSDPAKQAAPDMSASLRASKAFRDLEAEIHAAQGHEQGAPPPAAAATLPIHMLGESTEPAGGEPPVPAAVPEPPVATTPEN